MSGAINSSFDIRLRAVRAVLDEQLPVTIVAQAYGTDRSTVHRWIARFQTHDEQGLVRRPANGRPRKLADLDH